MAYDKDAILDTVYTEMCEGKSVEDICSAKGMPNAATIYRWLIDEEKCEQYARAKAVRAERFAHKVITTAEDEDLKPDDKRVRIDAYKWAAGKLYGKYSDKTLLGSDPENPLPAGGLQLTAELTAQQAAEVYKKLMG